MDTKKHKNKTARQVALDALLRCEKEGYANLVLKEMLDKSGLSARDRAFAARLVYGTVERKLTLEARLAPFLRQPLNTMPPQLRCILRSGLYQALYMDAVPVHAAVSESVALCKQAGKGSAAGFVNAVLRRAAQAPFEPVFTDEADRLSVTWSVGREVTELFLRAYPDRAEAILAAAQKPAELIVRENLLKLAAGSLPEALAKEEVTALPLPLAGAYRLEGAGDVAKLAAFKQGLFHVQGLASQLTVEALDVKPGQTVLDLCAAPGGKSATIAGKLQNKGALYSCELHQNRLPLIRQLLERLGVQNAAVLQNDAARFNEKLPMADRVLCDVPCSGLGTLAKKPDIRYKDLAELPTLIETQKKILSTAAKYLAPGGKLVYSTCTINPAENEQVVQAFLKEHPEFAVDMPDLSAFGAEDAAGMALFMPDRCGTDGFFIARLCKKG